jgi:hypothetical protein
MTLSNDRHLLLRAIYFLHSEPPGNSNASSGAGSMASMQEPVPGAQPGEWWAEMKLVFTL